MAEIILPPEENEEIPQVPELNIDKPSGNSKVITIEFEAKKTNKVSTKDTNQQLYTTDTDAWFEFKETSLESANGTYSVVFRNRHDGSIFQRTGDVVNGVAYYKIPHQEIRHAGAWRGQVVYTLSNGDTTAREFDYDVKGHILGGKDVREIVVEDFETLMAQLRSMKENAEVELANLTQELENTTDTAEQNETDRQAFFDNLVEDIDELQANYQELLDTGVLQTNINTKLEALEEEYAPKLTEVTAQLAQTESQKVDKNGSGQVTWANMAQDARENISGDKTAVVGIDSVLTKNIVDKSVTSPKRSVLGEMGILTIPESRRIPDLNLNSKTFTIYEGSYIIHRNNRYNISQDTSIPLETGDAGVMLFFDTKAGTFRFVSTNELKAYVHEDSILMMSIVFTINQSKIGKVWSPFDFTLNGGPLKDEPSGLGLLDSGIELGKNKVLGTLLNIIVNIYNNVVESPDTRYSHIAKIEPNKQYTIKKFEGGSRFRIALLSEYPASNNLPIVPDYFFEGEESSDPQEHTFMNEKSNYAVVFTTITTHRDALAKVQVEEGDKSTAYSDSGFSIFGNPINQSGTSNKENSFYIYDDIVGVYDSPDLPSVATGEDFVLDTSHHEDIYDLYDGLVSESPSYITRELLGSDTIDNPIYCYNFIPQTVDSDIPIERPKLILLSGLHGNEKMSVWGLAQFLKDIHDNWKDDPILEFIRGNFELSVVPMCNPSGYDLNQRKNYNGVDLNRNFPLSNWREMDDPGNINYGGPSPASEIETQIIVDFLDNNTDADYLVDFHNFYQHDGYVMWMPVANIQHKKIGINVMNTLSRKWKKQYSHFPQDDSVLGFTNNTNIPTLKLYGDSVGIPSTTHESVHQVTYGVGTKMYDKITTNCAVDWIGNYLAGIAKTLR